MLKPISIDLFVEDHAHELFVSALIDRISREENVAVNLRVRSARGGHPRVVAELAILKKAFEDNLVSLPDSLVCVIDGNCKGFSECRKEIEKTLGESLSSMAVFGCPDPHIERWFFADMDCFERLFGVRPSVARRKCSQDYYKNLLLNSLRNGGNQILLHGIEYGPQLATQMDLYRAGQAEKTLGLLIDGVVQTLRSWARLTERL
jgi:hypothetical protein